MLRTILEIIYLLSIIYLSIHYYKLFKNVVKLRRELKVSVGFKGESLERAIRAHANFSETAPFIILLTFILYFNNLLIFACSSLILLVIGRTIHSKAISNCNENIEDRRKGMRLTVYSLMIAIIGIIFYICKLVYFTFEAAVNTTFLPQIIPYIIGFV